MNASTDRGAWAPGTTPGAAERSPADLEREGEEIRADLDRTLDEIERKLSPGELLDRSVDFLRNNGSDFLREAGETVRNNPVPVILTAAGLVWLTTSIVSRNRNARGTGYASGYEESGDFSSYRGSSADFGEQYGHEGGIRSKVDEARSRMSNAAHRMTDRVSGTAQDVAGRVRGRFSNSSHAMQDRMQGVSSSVMNLVQEQPIAMGALALAAGALLGAAFPITRYENRMVGPTRDRTIARAKEMGQREYEHLKETVSSTLERRGTNGGASNEPPEQG